MGVKVFFETNLFVYSVSGVPGEEPKRRIAVTLLEEKVFHLSLQVVQKLRRLRARYQEPASELGDFESLTQGSVMPKPPQSSLS